MQRFFNLILLISFKTIKFILLPIIFKHEPLRSGLRSFSFIVCLLFQGCKEVPSLWKCYFLCHWKNFLLGGILKLAGDLVGLVAPLGIAVVVDYAAQSQLAEQSQVVFRQTVILISRIHCF